MKGSSRSRPAVATLLWSAVLALAAPWPVSAQPGKVKMETTEYKGWKNNLAAPANFLDWRAGVSDFESAAAYVDGLGSTVLTGRGEPVLLSSSFPRRLHLEAL